VPETSFNRLDHRTPLARAEVNRVGDWSDTSRTERLDPASHFPFEPLPATQPQPIPERPNEAELRKQLQHALEHQQAADVKAQRARDAHERAEHHREKCSRQLAEFATLDAEVVEHKVTALKCDVGRLDVDLPDELRRRIADRDLARTDLGAADRAAAVLLAERAEASAAAGETARAVERALCATLNATAEGIAVHFFASLREAERCVRALTGFDKFVAGRNGTLPSLVRDVLLAEPRDLRVPLGTASTDAWRAAGDRLKADVEASVSMDDLLPPAAPQRPPMMVTFNVTHAHASPHARWIGPLKSAADPEAAA
jgi:hypothetical protein